METLHAVLEAKEQGGVCRASVDDTVLAAVDEMSRYRVGALLVVESDMPIGIISERDLLTRVLLERRDPATTIVRDVMTTEVACISIEASPGEAMRIMTEHRCRHLPVIVDAKIVAMLSIGDVVRWLSRNQEYEIRMLREYVTGTYPG
jgi:CBS domain-containing protein